MRTYGELKDAVRMTLGNRKDLDNMIPLFVALSERRIYRTVRVPANEITVTFEPGEDGFIQLPRDYLECKYLTVTHNNREIPLSRIGDIELKQRMAKVPGEGIPEVFSRFVKQIHWHPHQDVDNLLVNLTYWQDFSGQLVNDTDTNELIRIAPGLYLYGALMEASLYIGHDERVEIWNDKFAQELSQLNEHAHEAEYSGSALRVEYPY